MSSYTQQLKKLLDEHIKKPVSDFKEAAMLLIEQGADLTTQNHQGYTLFHSLVLSNKNGENNNELTKLFKSNSKLILIEGVNNISLMSSVMRALLNQFSKNQCSLEDFRLTALLLLDWCEEADFLITDTLTGSKHNLLHHLALNNLNGVNDESIKTLLNGNRELIKAVNGYSKTVIQCLMNQRPNPILNKNKSCLPFKILKTQSCYWQNMERI
jgi:hypothetical protein